MKGLKKIILIFTLTALSFKVIVQAKEHNKSTYLLKVCEAGPAERCGYINSLGDTIIPP
ncbi:MAG: hypothetical protein HQ541_23785 [Mariniphaga sp.]|nr:hypothetical protein [Mariniphaga sp.]